MTDVVIDQSSRDSIDAIERDLRKRFEETGRQLLKPRMALWHDLGKVYEESGTINDKAALRAALVEKIRQRDDLPPLKEWDPLKKSTLELLLVLATGYEDTESSRSQYLAALRNASREGVTKTEAGFANWVEKKHGIINAGKVADAEAPTTSVDLVAQFAQKLQQERDRGHEVDTKLESASFDPDPLGNGFGILLVHKGRDGKLVVNGTTGNLNVVASAIRAVDHKVTPAQAARAEGSAKSRLMKVALKLEDLRRGGLDAEELAEFSKAAKELYDLAPDKYFTGEPFVENDRTTGKPLVQNDDFHILDPGRFIRNAKRSALQAFDLDGFNYDPNAKKMDMKKLLSQTSGYADWNRSASRANRKKQSAI